MTNVAKKLEAALGVSKAARSAQTIEEHEAVVERVAEQREAAVHKLADLEQQRTTIVLDGGNLSEFHEKLDRAKAEAETLRQAWEEAKRRLADAMSAKYQKDLEDAAGECRDIHVPGAEQALLDFHKACEAATEASKRWTLHAKAIESSDENVKRHDRPQLVIDLQALRARVVTELAPPFDESDKPVRYGKFAGDPEFERGRALYETHTVEASKQFLVWQARNADRFGGSFNRFSEHESERAYQLRLRNWVAQKTAASKREDPINVAATKAVDAIEKALSLTVGAFEASRGVRRVKVTKYVTDGRATANMSFADGLPGKGNFRPR